MVLSAWLGPTASASNPSEPAKVSAPRDAESDRVEFPGVIIDLKNKCVDIEASVCLDRGPLELIACTRGTKEHESIVSINARPKHVHLGLLLIGTRNGNPAMSREVPVKDSTPRWIDIPPRGDPIEVFLVLKDAAGQSVEHPISDFVMRSEGDRDPVENGGALHTTNDAKLLNSFVFAGSHVIKDDEGRSQYLADIEGNVISISTFGDEVLCLPGWNSDVNAALAWQINPAKLPKVGSKVTLRLRPSVRTAEQGNAVGSKGVVE
ncbi:MAG: hypothetical protein GC159_03295 [Phycisphaera sp.]|nr:hypothetical protein [Phycisphaera sp.]